MRFRFWKLKLRRHTVVEEIDAVIPPAIDRLRAASFNEADYLDANPDVLAAVQSLHIESGFDHWMRSGKQEGRPLRKSPK
jgi:hypothetical protein